MPERTSYEPGTPSWVDLQTSDPNAAKRFYGELFGWEAHTAGTEEETGGYFFFTREGRMVAGGAPLMTEGQPVAWSTYVATDDADAVSERAQAAGAQVIAGPMDIMEAGRMAFFAHPAAGMIGVWQAGEHKGAQLVNEPGSMDWNELMTRDVEGAKAFGAAVFGWRAEDQDYSGSTYTILHVGEDGVAGMLPMPAGVPDEVPAYWGVVFAVEDCDAAVATLQRLGGTVTMGPQDLEGVGRFAYVADPQGGMFAVIESAARA